MFTALVLFGLLVPGVTPHVALSQGSRQQDYIVRAGDLLKIRVWPDSALGGSFPVEETGSALLPIIGELKVAGLPIGAIRADLRKRYALGLKEPVVTVTPVFRVSVLGAVERPGLYDVDPTHTVFDVISMAGGFAENARETNMRLVRGSSSIPLNGRDALEGRMDSFAIALESGDRIIVPAQKRSVMSGINLVYFVQSLTFVATIINLLK